MALKIDMTPPNILAETVKQVVKILKSPGCRCVHIKKLQYDGLIVNFRKTPVFVKSIEIAVEIASSFGTEKSVFFISLFGVILTKTT
jgi:hypothetical protein